MSNFGDEFEACMRLEQLQEAANQSKSLMVRMLIEHGNGALLNYDFLHKKLEEESLPVNQTGAVMLAFTFLLADAVRSFKNAGSSRQDISMVLAAITHYINENVNGSVQKL